MKMDMKLAKFDKGIDDLKQTISKDILKSGLNSDGIKEIGYKCGELKYLIDIQKRWSYCIFHGNIEITSMFSKKGNKLVTSIVKETIKMIPDNIDKVENYFKKEFKEISKKHKEINDTDVREQIHWHLTSFETIYDIEFDY